MRKGLVVAGLVGLLLAVWPMAQARADVPWVLNFSGRIGTETANLTGQVGMTVSIWTDPTTTDVNDRLWQEPMDVAVAQGRFNVLLGANAENPLPATLLARPEVYLSVAVTGDAEMQPRLRIAAVPFALEAGDARTFAGKTTDAFANAVHNHDGVYLKPGQPDSITSEMIVDRSVQMIDMADGGCQDGQIIKWHADVGTWRCGEDLNSGSSYSFGTGLIQVGDKVTLLLTCAQGNVLKWNGTGWVCESDEDTKYLAGPGLILNGTVFSVDNATVTGWAKTACYDTPEELYVLLDSRYATPGHNHDTVYLKVGASDSITSPMIKDGTIAFADIGANGCTTGQVLKYGTGTWTCGTDNDAGGKVKSVTTPAGSGITIAGTLSDPTVSVDASWIDSRFWKVGGNAGTTAGVNYVGTSDNVPLELRVGGSRVMRLEPSLTSPNIISGHAQNSISIGVYGGTVAGGGSVTAINRVTDVGGTVSGGQANVAGDGLGTQVDSQFATVAGGAHNTAAGSWSAIGGGASNTAGGENATVAGGSQNVASGLNGTVGGGSNNTASGDHATVPGGYLNTALGKYAVATGFRAKANHDGSFVFADGSTNSDFGTTAANQFVVRATGGIEFTGNMDVSGTVQDGLQLYRKAGNNGTVDCNTYCQGLTWGPVGACLGGRKDLSVTNAHVGCTDKPNESMTCICIRIVPGF